MRKSPAGIHLATDVDSFFENEIAEASRKQGLELTPFTHRYLGRMLSRFSSTRNFLNTETGADEKATFHRLSLLWLDGQTKNPVDQLQQFQLLGDVALFTSGFFAERISRTAVDMDYYIAMGGQAYERAAHLRESIQAERALNIFFELSESFTQLVDVLAEVSDRALLANDRDLIKLYEKWLSTRSERIRRMLSESGVIAGGEGN